jgi:hypothetical protein
MAMQHALQPVIAQLPDGYRIEIGDKIEKATKASTARCLLSARCGRSKDRHRFSEAVVRGGSGKWLGRVDSGPSWLP